MRILGYLPMAAQTVMLWGSAATLAVYLIVLMLLIAVLTDRLLTKADREDVYARNME